MRHTALWRASQHILHVICSAWIRYVKLVRCTCGESGFHTGKGTEPHRSSWQTMASRSGRCRDAVRHAGILPARALGAATSSAYCHTAWTGSRRRLAHAAAPSEVPGCRHYLSETCTYPALQIPSPSLELDGVLRRPAAHLACSTGPHMCVGRVGRLSHRTGVRCSRMCCDRGRCACYNRVRAVGC